MLCVCSRVWEPLKQVRCLLVCWQRPAEDNTVSYQCSWPELLTFARFFQTFAKELRFCSFLFQAWCKVLFNSPSLSAETQSYESACHYSQLQISLHGLGFTDAEDKVYGLYVKKYLRNEVQKTIRFSKIKIIFLRSGPSYMKFLTVFTPLVKNSRWPANWN